jgi:hypothetical protein
VRADATGGHPQAANPGKRDGGFVRPRGVRSLRCPDTTIAIPARITNTALLYENACAAWRTGTHPRRGE